MAYPLQMQQFASTNPKLPVPYRIFISEKFGKKREFNANNLV